MQCKLAPLKARVVVRKDEPLSKSGNIFLPDTAQKKTTTGTVMAVGPGGETKDGVHVPMLLKVGQRVVFSAWAGANVINNQNDLGDDLVVMEEDDILAVLVG